MASTASSSSSSGPSSSPCYTVVLVRHGQSSFNKANLFTGWADPALTAKGIEEARIGGRALKVKGISFDVAFTSMLKRAIQTLFYIQEEIDQHYIPVKRRWRLNERHYGALTALNKHECACKYGEKQVKIWRRSYDIIPPPSDEKSIFNPVNDAKYKGIDLKLLPKCESLKSAMERVLPCWHNEIVPEVQQGKTALVVCHGNCVRGFIKHLQNLSDMEVMELNIPTGVPILCRLDKNMKLVSRTFLAEEVRRYFIFYAERVKAEIEVIINQGKALPSCTKFEGTAPI